MDADISVASAREALADASLCTACGVNKRARSGPAGRRGRLCDSCKRRPHTRHKAAACAKCGFVAVDRAQLDLVRIDGNPRNDDPSNLRTLCANCHRLVTRSGGSASRAADPAAPATTAAMTATVQACGLPAVGPTMRGCAADERPRALLHQTWKTTTGVPAVLEAYRASWAVHNPELRARLWDDDESREYVAAREPELVRTYDSMPHFIMRVDVARYVWLFHEGGIYADLDVECRRPMTHLLEPGAHLVLEDLGAGQVTVGNALMASSPGHPFWRHVLELVKAKAAQTGRARFFHLSPERQRGVVLRTTGPYLLTEALESFDGSGLVTVHDEASCGALHHRVGTWWRDRPSEHGAGPARSPASFHGRSTGVPGASPPMRSPLDWLAGQAATGGQKVSEFRGNPPKTSETTQDSRVFESEVGSIAGSVAVPSVDAVEGRGSAAGPATPGAWTRSAALGASTGSATDRARSRARRRAASRSAVYDGRLPPPASRPCADCGAQAEVYKVADEADGAGIAEAAEALCRGCVGKRRPWRGAVVPSAKLSDADVLELRRLAGRGLLQRELAARFGVSLSTINRAVRGGTWTHVRDDQIAPLTTEVQPSASAPRRK